MPPAERDSCATGKTWLKAELHSHCNRDPVDYQLCAHSPEELILEASRLGYHVVAITCHDLDVWSSDLAEFAKNKGVILIPGMEVTTEEGKHVLVYNFGTSADNLNSFAKIRMRSRSDTLVVAPHAFFPNRTSLGPLLERHIDIVDAIEHCGFFSRKLDFNERAIMMARDFGKPMLGASDVHHLWQLGKTYTLVYAAPTLCDIVAAIKEGRVQVRVEPLSNREIARWWITLVARKRFFFTKPRRGAGRLGGA